MFYKSQYINQHKYTYTNFSYENPKPIYYSLNNDAYCGYTLHPLSLKNVFFTGVWDAGKYYCTHFSVHRQNCMYFEKYAFLQKS